jgi:Protein of unknown function DUF262/Protein of unknown function (DUF1524)
MKNQKETIRRIVRYLNNPEKDGGFWLPNIQRPFVWKEEQIERLFDSIMREYPISTLLVWKTTSEVRRRKFIDNYRLTLKLSDFYVPDDRKPKLLVLDGQQRLQSLFIGLCGSYEGRELYFDALSGELREPDDVKYVFQFLEPAKAQPPWFKFKDIVFSERTYDDLADHLIDHFPEPPSREDQRKIRRHVAQVVKTFQTDETIVYQELDSIDRPELYTEDDVVEVFIRANSGGTRLGKSDLLFSLLISAWDEADDQMDDLLDRLNSKGYAFNRDFVLKTCLTLLNKGARYEVEKFRDGKTRQQIEENWEKITAAILDVQDFLYGRTFVRCDKALPSYLVLIPVIYFRYHYPQEWRVVANLEQYLIRTLLSGAFSGLPDQVIDRCVARIREDGDFVVEHIFDVIRAENRNLEITEDRLLTSGYGSDTIHLIFNLWYVFNYEPAYANNLPQVDHIFPQSLLRKVKELNPNTGRVDLTKYKESARNQLANCRLLTQRENGAGGKSDKPPAEWFKDKPDAFLDLHLIPRDPALWEMDQFEAFVEARNRLILEKFGWLLQAKGSER